MKEPPRRCPQCGDALEHRYDGEIVVQNANYNINHPIIDGLLFNRVDSVYVEIQVWGCPVCGHIELVDQKYKAEADEATQATKVLAVGTDDTDVLKTKEIPA